MPEVILYIGALAGSWDTTRVVEEILAVLAIALAVWHAIKLKQQVSKVQSLTGALGLLQTQLTEQVGRGVQEIREALPTKRLGKFPAFLPDIVNLVQKAHQTIEVFCDYPAYGSFSDSDTFVLYKRAIEDQIRDEKRVTIACLDGNTRRQETSKQESGDGENWEQTKTARHDAFTKYLRYHAPGVTVQSLTNENFQQLIMKEDDFVLEEVFRRARQLPMTVRPTVYFWLVDGDSMIFVIPSASRLEEHGFYTQDSHLIASLKEIARAFCPSFLQQL